MLEDGCYDIKSVQHIYKRYFGGVNTILIHYKNTSVLNPGIFRFPIHSVRI